MLAFKPQRRKPGCPVKQMEISINNEILSQLINGIIAVIILVAAGGVLAFASRMMINKRVPFTRLALILALPPFCLINLLDRGSVSTLYLYAIIVIVLGMAIDGTAHLIRPEKLPGSNRKKKAPATGSEPDPDAIVWEKVE